MVNVFAVPVFFIVFRETLESGIIVSILLAFIKQQMGPDRDKVVYRKLRNQVWLATGIGLLICIIVGCSLIGAFYGIGVDGWGSAEDLWEGIFSLIASIIITLMGAAILRVSKLQEKWRVKLAKALATKDNSATSSSSQTLKARFKRFCEKYAMFMLPFITILREGLEAVVFIGGVSLGVPAAAIPIPTISGLIAGYAVGYLIYASGNFAPIQLFLIVSTCFLYLVAAGLFSKSVWFLEQNHWNHVTGGDAAETGSGPGSYNIHQSVWHVNCCNPEINGGGGWGVFNSIFGWQNSATYGSVLSYNLYWLAVVLGFLALMYYEKKGHWPLMKPKQSPPAELSDQEVADNNGQQSGVVLTGKETAGAVPLAAIRSMDV
ncbi:hypothetical protein VTN02DRAFT_2622 [Thermoascus thermophilus]